MNSNDIIKNAYNYYDELSEKYDLEKSSIKEFKVSTLSSDLQEPLCNFIINNKKYKANYTILGNRIEKDNKFIFKWGWSLLKESKNLTYLTRQLLKYGLDITTTEDNDIKQLLCNSVIEVKSMGLEVLIILSLYLTKCELFTTKEDDIILIYNIKKIN